MSDTSKAIFNLAPKASWALDGPEIIWEQSDQGSELVASNLTWFSPEIAIPSKEAIDAELVRLEAEFAANEYQQLRRKEYPPLSDLADAVYWQSQGDDSKMTAYLAAVEAVKQKYPKGV